MPPCNVENETEQEIEYASVKFLLKQVYSAHINKIRGLQDELNCLKEELESTKRELNDGKSNCKQCKELQDAFTACKTALSEQTRRFESLGQKISDSKEKDARVELDDFPKDKNANFKPEQFTKDYNRNEKKSDLPKIKVEENSQLFSQSEKHSLDQTGNAVVQNKAKTIVNLLNASSPMLGVMPERSSLSCDAGTISSDSFVLVPDSEDIFTEKSIKQEIVDVSSPNQKALVISNPKQKVLDNSSPNVLKSKVGRKKFRAANQSEVIINHLSEELSKLRPENGRKRTLSDCSDGKLKTKKYNNLKTVISSNMTVKIDKRENDSLENCTKIVHADKGEIEIMVTRKISPKSKGIGNHCGQSKAGKRSYHVKALDVRICNASETVPMKEQRKSKENLPVCVNEENSKNCDSASIKQSVPCVSKRSSKKDLSFEEISSDNDDFQSVFSGTSYPTNSIVSKFCDKKQQKKLTKLKFRSKYKMTLDAPSLNYKKPNYKQTKLSQNIFKSKVPVETLQQIEVGANLEAESPVHETFANVKGTLSMDFDATCIPDYFKFNGTQNSNVLGDIGNICEPPGLNIKSPSEELQPEKSFKESLSQDLLADACILREMSHSMLNLGDDEEEDIIAFQDKRGKEKSKENTDSFDRLPIPEEPNYKYKEETVRNKVQRKQLNAFECKDCENYFSELGLTDKEKQNRLKQCSRHRAKFVPPSTPDHFWEIAFPDTQECKVRGYQGETQMVQLKPRRRRPLT